MPDKTKPSDADKLRARMQKLNAGVKKSMSKEDFAKNANAWMSANRQMKKVGPKPGC